MITDEGHDSAAEWSRHGREYLDTYLIQEVEHPAINPQSVLIRAFIADRLLPGKFSALVDEEIYYSACACFALLGQREGWFPALYAQILGPTEAEDAELPEFLRKRFRQEASPRCNVQTLFEDLAKCLTLGFEFFESPYSSARQNASAAVEIADSDKIRVLELACGSANDYRFFDQYGLTRFLDYSGVDVCPENIENARRRHPQVDFQVDDATRLDAEDGEYAVVMAFDLFEHLSPSGLEAAIDEAVRVCQGELWLSFFNLVEAPAHQFTQKGNYHWNALSLAEVSASLQRAGCARIEVISIQNELENRFPGYRHYNADAHILIASSAAGDTAIG